MELDFTLEDKNELEFELDDTEINVEINKDHDKLNHRDYPDQHPISAITGLQEAIDNSGKQVYRGADQPTDEKILIWIDTSESPTPTTNALITSDDKTFITSDNKTFITA